jgi:hypothetical protein
MPSSDDIEKPPDEAIFLIARKTPERRAVYVPCP